MDGVYKRLQLLKMAPVCKPRPSHPGQLRQERESDTSGEGTVRTTHTCRHFIRHTYTHGGGVGPLGRRFPSDLADSQRWGFLNKGQTGP
ncbi:hypothetical protein D623_10002632 [Myotis brandtii]|uniref:Uncharacterized protein n=1 Tax=Myotis brandtii TaxID=109478 RepID=S7MMX3_MYOBR|nr:hypothetical protein D623_10002632 [Myotis brandtii]